MTVNRIRNGQRDNLAVVSANLKKVLWQNVSQLMQRRWGEENLNRLAKAGKMGPGSAQRIKDQETSIGLDLVAKAAQAFNIPAYQLLVPADAHEVLRIMRVWDKTDDTGRLMMKTALEAAEQRAEHEKGPGVDKTSETNQR
jgi:hypothetical protein